ncbi:glycosyltransferase [Candidatus Daviesbacteria bacterium]|nr:glycosyltransferase [Candidatus Daviesbacteria bacterium]
MKIAIICSNFVSITKDVKKGTEIFDHILINNLAKADKNLDITAFASGDSNLPVKIESIDYHPAILDKSIIQKDKHVIFELALISRAFSKQDNFDLYHINIGDGDIALPFAPFVKKPLLITLHYTQEAEYIDKYFSLFSSYKNVSFVSISNAQRNFFPDLNYAGTIYHGIETETFKFDSKGGESIIWAGRGVPDKGLNIVFQILKKIQRKARIFPLKKQEHIAWLNKQVADLKDLMPSQDVFIEFDKDRFELVNHYQLGRLFLFPIQWEEPFGLVLIESMACGTPVVAFARGSVPEIVKDGKTGFIVNPAETDIRGDWVIKKTGIDGLCEAIEKIYSMPEKEYQKMRQNCRSLVEKSFSADKMAKEYMNVYRKIVLSNHSILRSPTVLTIKAL